MHRYENVAIQMTIIIGLHTQDKFVLLASKIASEKRGNQGGGGHGALTILRRLETKTGSLNLTISSILISLVIPLCASVPHLPVQG
jgi:hypothetical protein